MKTRIIIIALAFFLLLAASIDAATYAGDGANLWQYEQPRLSLAVTPYTQPFKSAVFVSPLSPLPTPTPRFELH